MSNNNGFTRLLSPITIGNLKLRNRIVLAPHNIVFLGGHGNNSNRTIDYFVERAKGGAGLIVMTNFVIPRSWLRMGSWGGVLPVTSFGALNMLNDPALCDDYRRLCGEIKENGAAFIAQMNAGGRQHGTPGTTEFGLPLLAPSAIPCPRTRAIPKAMTRAEIREFVCTFAEAARNVQAFGGDGVEILAAQGYLLSSFLSPLTNQREDEFGGELMNRMRFLLDVLDAIRMACGASFTIGVRMNGHDGTPGGFALEDAVEVARYLGAEGKADYINVSGLTYADFPGWISDMNTPEAHFAPDAHAIKQASALPVCVVSRVPSPAAAEKILADGHADLVGMARALISDPYFPNKARKGDTEDIRGCTYCNQTCLMGWEAGRGLGCLHNPAVGKETQLGEGKLKHAKTPKRVVVVGGGPAGMSAARLAAERGHSVALLESSDALGGQNRFTAMMKSRSGFGEVTRWLTHRLSRLGVEVFLNQSANLESVLHLAPDAVIVATGSRPRRDGFSSVRADVPELKGLTNFNALAAIDVFSQPEALGDKIVLIDDDPHLTGIFVAEHIAALGKEVTIVTPHLHAGRELVIGHVPPIYARLRKLGVKIVSNAVPEEVVGRVLRCFDRSNGESIEVCPVDTVVLAMGNISNNELPKLLEGHFEFIYSAGDCVAPRRLDDAIFDGARAGAMV